MCLNCPSTLALFGHCGSLIVSKAAKWLKKTEGDVEMSGDTITLTLTQQETLAFSPRQNIRLQVKVLTASGAVLASAIKELTVREILNKEVLT